MATYVVGNPVANATRYELFKKSGASYSSLATAQEINFEVSALGLEEGNHTLVVKAKADGYSDSGYSNEVTYVVASSFPTEEVWYVTEYDAATTVNDSIPSLASFAHKDYTAALYAGKWVNSLGVSIKTSGTLSYGKVSATSYTKLGTLNVTAAEGLQIIPIDPVKFSAGESFWIQSETDTALFRFSSVGTGFHISVTDADRTGDIGTTQSLGINLGYVPR